MATTIIDLKPETSTTRISPSDKVGIQSTNRVDHALTSQEDARTDFEERIEGSKIVLYHKSPSYLLGIL